MPDSVLMRQVALVVVALTAFLLSPLCEAAGGNLGGRTSVAAQLWLLSSWAMFLSAPPLAQAVVYCV